MAKVRFHPHDCPQLAANTYDEALWHIEHRHDFDTTQMCMLNHVKDYDVIEIVGRDGNVAITITNNHDGTYDCAQIDRTLRRINSFFHLWENEAFDVQLPIAP